MERAPILMIIAFPRLPLGKWEKVAEGLCGLKSNRFDEGSGPQTPKRKFYKSFFLFLCFYA